jgi:epoxyqueuosine reductase
MTDRERTQHVKTLALESGANVVGVVDVESLPEHAERISRLLPSTQSVMVTVSAHSLASIRSDANQIAQFDTIHTYNECARAAHTAARFLESEGFPALAVPAFIPIDMDEPGKGMRGEICWRRAGVRAGLGSYGENGLLVTPEFGSAIRISGLVTTAQLVPDSPLEDDVCDHCMNCVNSCPVQALSGNGKINKKLCGEHIFKFGFRFFQRFVKGLADQPTEALNNVIDGYELREMWQTFMTGNYYYCYRCQAQCRSSALRGTS